MRQLLETFGEGFQEAVLGHEYMKAEHMKKKVSLLIY